MNLSALDLNLLLVLHAVLEERSATLAAKRLNVTQSAVSNALARLRAMLGDPLVVRSGRGLVPTPRAEELAPALAEVVAKLETALDHGRAFVPEESTRTFTLAAADNNQARDVPLVAAAFAQQLPRATLRIVSVDFLVASDGLATGEVDAVIMPGGLADGLRSAPLVDEASAFLVRKDHPVVGDRLTPKLFGEVRHVDVQIPLGRPGFGHQVASRAWKALGLSRDVAVVVPSFATAALIAAKTDLVAGVPRRAAEVYCEMLPLRIVPATFATPVLPMALAWHERTHADPGAAYFRGLVLAAVRVAPRRGRAVRRRSGT